MTREEQIAQAAADYTSDIFDELESCDSQYDFIMGAQWADEHPKESEKYCAKITVDEFIKNINSNKYYTLQRVTDLFKDKVCYITTINNEYIKYYYAAVNIYRCKDGYVGVRGLYEMKDSVLHAEDMEHICKAQEYKEIITIAYEPK